MMVNCPKCQLLQPKDQYCARCGINMETWQPPKIPLWKKLLSNWMVQLGLLFVVILAVVLLDNFRAPQSSSNNIERAELRVPENSPEQDSQYPENEISAQEEASQSFASPSQATMEKSASPETTSAAAEPWQQKANLRVLTINQPLLEKISQTGQRLDSAHFLLPRQQLETLLRENNTQFFLVGSANGQFQWEQPLPLFVGEEDLETGLSLGFFIQMRFSHPIDNSSARTDLRHWTQLQLNGEMGPQIPMNTLLDPDLALVLIDLSVNEMDFTPEERTLFEASPRLRALNDAGFGEGLSEIVLVLTLD